MQTPKLTVPPKACDCHMHVYEGRFAHGPTATFKPPPAPVSEYRKVQAALGLQRVVVVQPTAYGFDNACTMQALLQRCRGVIFKRRLDGCIVKLITSSTRSPVSARSKPFSVVTSAIFASSI